VKEKRDLLFRPSVRLNLHSTRAHSAFAFWLMMDIVFYWSVFILEARCERCRTSFLLLSKMDRARGPFSWSPEWVGGWVGGGTLYVGCGRQGAVLHVVCVCVRTPWEWRHVPQTPLSFSLSRAHSNALGVWRERETPTTPVSRNVRTNDLNHIINGRKQL
jgi:hypothetical protein